MKKEKFEYIKGMIESGRIMVDVWTGEAHIKKVDGSGFMKWIENHGYYKTMSGGWTIALHEVIAVAGGLAVVDKHEKLYINHIDGNKKNCRLFNLEVVNNSQNNKHAWELGLKKVAPQRLTKEDVLKIKALASVGFKQSDISEAMNVSQTHVSSIVTGFRWGSVNLDEYVVSFKEDVPDTSIEECLNTMSIVPKLGV